MNRRFGPGIIAISLMLLAGACSANSADRADEIPIPAGLGQVCVHMATPAESRDELTAAVNASRAQLLARCPGGAETDEPVVAFPGFNPGAPEVAAAELGRIVRSTEGGFELVRVALVRSWPDGTNAADMATRMPIAPSLFYCQGGNCEAVQFEVYAPPGMDHGTLIRRIEAAAGIGASPGR